MPSLPQLIVRRNRQRRCLLRAVYRSWVLYGSSDVVLNLLQSLHAALTLHAIGPKLWKFGRTGVASIAECRESVLNRS